MKIKTYKYNYIPQIDEEDVYFWQIKIFPELTIVRLYDYEWENTEFHSNYITISIGWLFWTYDINIDFNKKSIKYIKCQD